MQASMIILTWSTHRTDLVEVCRHLGYDDDYADDILNQIGQDGFISYEAFAQSNLALLTTDVSVAICMLSISSLFRAGSAMLIFYQS